MLASFAPPSRELRTLKRIRCCEEVRRGCSSPLPPNSGLPELGGRGDKPGRPKAGTKLAMTSTPDTTSRPRGAMRPSCAFISRPQGGRGECRVPAAPAVSCALCIGRTHTSNNEYTGTPGIPARNGFTAYVVLSPVTGLFCHRHFADIVLSLPGWADRTPQNLTPASGRQDHTILPSLSSRQTCEADFWWKTSPLRRY
jgi:hypothetical protein